jgi:hypothetical protein
MDGMDGSIVQLLAEGDRALFGTGISYGSGETPLDMGMDTLKLPVEYQTIVVDTDSADVFISGHLRVVSSLMGGSGSVSASGGYQVFLQRSDNDPTFSSPDNLTSS